MEDKKQTAPVPSDSPAPRADVDDLIFRGEGWHLSDR